MDGALHDFFLTSSGVLAIAAGITHGVLGETKVFARAQITPSGTRRLIGRSGFSAWSRGSRSPCS